MTAPCTIRPAVSEDLPAVIDLIRALAAFEKLPAPDEDAGRRLCDDFARGDRFRLLVAEAGGGLLGYALYFYTYSSFLAHPTLYLEDVFVLPTARGHGIGESLLRALAGEAHAQGCGRFEWTVLDWNAGAQRFYQRLGARLLTEWRICRADRSAIAQLARATE